MKIYHKGELWHSASGMTREIDGPTTSSFKVGSYNSGTGNYDGVLDDISIYNRELTSGEIKNLYNLGIE